MAGDFPDSVLDALDAYAQRMLRTNYPYLRMIVVVPREENGVIRVGVTSYFDSGPVFTAATVKDFTFDADKLMFDCFANVAIFRPDLRPPTPR